MISPKRSVCYSPVLCSTIRDFKDDIYIGDKGNEDHDSAGQYKIVHAVAHESEKEHKGGKKEKRKTCMSPIHELSSSPLSCSYGRAFRKLKSIPLSKRPYEPRKKTDQ